MVNIWIKMYNEWDNMEKRDEKHIKSLWVVFTPTNIFPTSIYQFIFSDTKTIVFQLPDKSEEGRKKGVSILLLQTV